MYHKPKNTLYSQHLTAIGRTLIVPFAKKDVNAYLPGYNVYYVWLKFCFSYDIFYRLYISEKCALVGFFMNHSWIKFDWHVSCWREFHIVLKKISFKKVFEATHYSFLIPF